jgi:hypothetical protein
MSTSTGSMVARMRGAAFLSVQTFEDVEHDESATAQAAMVVAMVAVARAIGALGSGPVGAAFAAIGAVVGWAVWAGICYLVGDKVFGGTASWGEVMRTLGFAQAPGLLWLFAIIPILGQPLFFLLPLWIAAAGFIAIRQALDIGNGKTLLTILVALGVNAFLETIF